MLGLGKDDVVAFRTVGGIVVQGLLALTNAGAGIVEGETAGTIEYPGLYSLERYFDHRIRLD